MRLLCDAENRELWKKIYGEWSFCPSVNISIVPFSLKGAHCVFSLPNECWSGECEREVNDILKSAAPQELYALDWQHDCFLYSPREYGDFEKAWYDESTGCTVRFPTYYPNGDYRFFIACDFSCGILGHPWRKELWIFGEKLIEEFRKKKNKLNISEIAHG